MGNHKKKEGVGETRPNQYITTAATHAPSWQFFLCLSFSLSSTHVVDRKPSSTWASSCHSNRSIDFRFFFLGPLHLELLHFSNENESSWTWEYGLDWIRRRGTMGGGGEKKWRKTCVSAWSISLRKRLDLRRGQKTQLNHQRYKGRRTGWTSRRCLSSSTGRGRANNL